MDDDKIDLQSLQSLVDSN